MKHYEFAGAQAIHEFAFCSATDPTLDATNQVSAGKGWFNTSTLLLYFRNAANTAWTLIGTAP